MTANQIAEEWINDRQLRQVTYVAESYFLKKDLA